MNKVLILVDHLFEIPTVDDLQGVSFSKTPYVFDMSHSIKSPVVQ